MRRNSSAYFSNIVFVLPEAFGRRADYSRKYRRDYFGNKVTEPNAENVAPGIVAKIGSITSIVVFATARWEVLSRMDYDGPTRVDKQELS